MRIRDIRKKIKKNMIVYFNYKKLTDHDYRSNFKDYQKHNYIKPEEQIKKEISAIKNYWKCDPMHYYRYRLYEKNLSFDELIDYIPPYYFYNYYMPSIYNNIDISVSQSKISMNDFFIMKKINTPFSIGIIKKGLIYNSLREKLLYPEFIEMLKESNSDKFFIKPDKGLGGNGIIVIRKIKSDLYIDEELLNEKLFVTRVKHSDYIIQESILQRSDLNTINPTSVNTLRVVTQYFNNAYKISAAVLRIGRNGSLVDNSAQGGISVNIDIEKGTLNKFAFTEHTMERFEKHPDTNFRFDGFILKEWDKIKLNILDFANKASEFPEIAWDIALLENKITAIEINSDYGLDHLQCCIGGMRRHLNILPLEHQMRN